MRVSEMVTINEINKWNKGDTITITAGTGAGKSYFIKNNLYAIAKRDDKKILMLVHRLNCLDQFQYEIQKDNKTDVITLATYQSIEHLGLNGLKSNHNHPSDFDYVVCDEFHYFMSDASFNKTTDLSLKEILDATNSIRIFMSATGDYVERYLKNYLKYNIKSYSLPIEFDFVKSLTFYNKDKTIEHFVNLAIKNNMKAIFFIQSATKAYELHKKYEEYSMFNCSKSHKLYQHVDEDKINKILHDEKFDDLILFTTTAMDTGVNIIDKELNNIVCDVDDVRTLQQCIGRKRLQHKDDYIHLVVKNQSNNVIAGKKGSLAQDRKMANFLRENTTRDFIKQFPRQYDKARIIYDKWTDNEMTKEINELAYFKCWTDETDYQEMIDLGKYGYAKFIAKKFGFYNEETNRYDYLVQEDLDEKDELEEYLDSIVGVKLLKENQKELINKIDVKVNGRQQKSYRKLNEGLEMINLPFVILPKKTKKYRYWIVEKIDR